jgi:hypothetical protein
MVAERYRIKDPTIAMSHDDGHGVAYTVSVGAIVEVQGGPFHGDRLVEVMWNGKTVMMFTQDLRLRGERIE